MSLRPPALDPTAQQLLAAYTSLLRDPGVARGIVAKGDLDRIEERHVADSLRGVAAIPRQARTLCDLGSGGGLPGIPLAIARPDIAVTLAERRANRASFLQLVLEALPLPNVEVRAGDVVSLPAASFDVCTARAFADLPRTWVAAEPLLSDGGRLLYWAGVSFDPHDEPPPGGRIELFPEPAVAGSGPLVIMTRQ